MTAIGASVRDLTGVTLGDFKIEKLLGRGGMGEVYLATQLSLSRPVALKVLRPNLASNPTYLGRLRSEATAVAKLNHPNIVHVYTFGCVDQINFIAMEYVQGTNLKEYIIKKGALDIPLAFSIMRQTGQAIGAAGEVGLVHRDVKPENILMTKKGRVKVADFGLCPRPGERPGSSHAVGCDDGNAPVHESGAGPGPCDRPSQRSLFAGRDLLPHAHRGSAVSRGDRPGPGPEAGAGSAAEHAHSSARTCLRSLIDWFSS